MFATNSLPTGGYVVAPGHCVTDGEGEDCQPGDTIALDEADATRLFALGFILDADGETMIHSDGPAVAVLNGVPVESFD